MVKRKLYLLSIALVILYSLFFALDLFFEIKSKSVSSKKQLSILKLENKFLDYVVLGSSRAYNGANINLIDKENKLNGLNLGYSGMGVAEQKLLFQKFIKKNKLKLLCLQVDYTTLNSRLLTYPFKEYLYFPYLEDEIVKKAIYNETSLKKYFLWKYVPFWKYAEFNTEYRKLIFNSNNDYSFEKLKGYHPPKKRNFNSKDHKIHAFYNSTSDVENEEITVVAKDLKDLEGIISTCKKEGVKVLLYTSPEFLLNKVEFMREMKDVLEVFKSFESLEVTYINWYNYDFCDDSLNFTNDFVHLSPRFVDDFSLMLGDSIYTILHND